MPARSRSRERAKRRLTGIGRRISAGGGSILGRVVETSASASRRNCRSRAGGSVSENMVAVSTVVVSPAISAPTSSTCPSCQESSWAVIRPDVVRP
ncbi:hypothetical protein [Saccharothrix xinjiangensis]|uniref:Uncharacterized protein n=1 Tax=Saccharothrix xinjiangensis TaxID=204798 RepID=A0ABV9Y772_9PSEU